MAAYYFLRLSVYKSCTTFQAKGEIDSQKCCHHSLAARFCDKMHSVSFRLGFSLPTPLGRDLNDPPSDPALVGWTGKRVALCPRHLDFKPHYVFETMLLIHYRLNISGRNFFYKRCFCMCVCHMNKRLLTYLLTYILSELHIARSNKTVELSN